MVVHRSSPRYCCQGLRRTKIPPVRGGGRSAEPTEQADHRAVAEEFFELPAVDQPLGHQPFLETDEPVTVPIDQMDPMAHRGVYHAGFRIREAVRERALQMRDMLRDRIGGASGRIVEMAPFDDVAHIGDGLQEGENHVTRA